MKTREPFVVVTSGRADQSPLAPLIDDLRAAGKHVIEASFRGTPIIPITAADVSAVLDRRLGAVSGFDGGTFVLLGDRFETAVAALYGRRNGWKILHIHGGERTIGVNDDQYRAAISKLADVHCVPHDAAYTNLFAGGVSPDKIRVTGSPSVDAVRRLLSARDPDNPPMFDQPYFVITLHPVRTAEATTRDLCCLLDALDSFRGYLRVWTSPGPDPHAEIIDAAIGPFYEFAPAEYVNAVAGAAAVIGNSSSGIIEAPVIGVASVDVGLRQMGRVRAPSVFHGTTSDEIAAAINSAIDYDGEFVSLYGDGTACEKIMAVINSDRW